MHGLKKNAIAAVAVMAILVFSATAMMPNGGHGTVLSANTGVSNRIAVFDAGSHSLVHFETWGIQNPAGTNPQIAYIPNGSTGNVFTEIIVTFAIPSNGTLVGNWTANTNMTVILWPCFQGNLTNAQYRGTPGPPVTLEPIYMASSANSGYINQTMHYINFMSAWMNAWGRNVNTWELIFRQPHGTAFTLRIATEIDYVN